MSVTDCLHREDAEIGNNAIKVHEKDGVKLYQMHFDGHIVCLMATC